MSDRAKPQGWLQINDGPLWADFTLTESIDRHDVTTQFRADPRWTHVDSAGHFHARSSDTSVPYPTLATRPDHGHLSTGTTCDECRSVTVCRICGEEVVPGVLPNDRRQYIAGMSRWQVTVTGLRSVVPAIAYRVRPGQGDEVTVRIGGMLADGSTWFGCAELTSYAEHGFVGGVIQWTRTLEGTGPLGRCPQ
jgi:hypothetical protein